MTLTQRNELTETWSFCCKGAASNLVFSTLLRECRKKWTVKGATFIGCHIRSNTEVKSTAHEREDFARAKRPRGRHGHVPSPGFSRPLIHYSDHL